MSDALIRLPGEDVDPDRVPFPGDLIQSTLADQAHFIVIRDAVDGIVCCIRGEQISPEGGDTISGVAVAACEVLKAQHVNERAARRAWKSLSEVSKNKFRVFVRENGLSAEPKEAKA